MPMVKRRFSIKSRNRLDTNTLHQRDKTKTRAPCRTPREEPPTRENEKKEKTKHKTPEPGRLEEHKFYSLNDWENNNHPMEHTMGKQKTPLGKGGVQAPLPGEQQFTRL
jgi:hypothetical protein